MYISGFTVRFEHIIMLLGLWPSFTTAAMVEDSAGKKSWYAWC